MLDRDSRGAVEGMENLEYEPTAAVAMEMLIQGPGHDLLFALAEACLSGSWRPKGPRSAFILASRPARPTVE